MKERPVTMGGWTFLLTVLLTAFGLHPLSPQVRAFIARSRKDLPPTNRVGGRVGDIVMHNERLVIVITAVNHIHRGAASGGNIVDVALTDKKGADALDQIFLFLGRYPRQGRYTRVRILQDGRGGVAKVVAEGRDSEDGTLKVTTLYALEAGKPYLRIKTTVTNTGKTTLKGFALGDAIQWGNALSFAPFFGFEIRRRTATLDWIGAEGFGIAYGWCTKTGKNRVINGLSWSDPIAVTTDLSPGQSVTYERYFIAAKTLSEVGKTAWTLQKVPLYRVAGKVRTRRTKRPAGGVQVIAEAIQKEAKKEPIRPLLALSVTDERGAFSLWLPLKAFPCRLKARHPGRLSLEPVTLPMPPKRPVTLWVSQLGILHFEIRDAQTNELLPSRLTFFGIPPTEMPHFGPSFVASGAENYVYTGTGKGKRTIPPGRYRVYATRGLEYDAAVKEIVVPEGKPVWVVFKLRRSVRTKGWISADFHLHCRNSFDSPVSLRDRLISCAAEGIEFAAITDHNFVTDPMPILKKLRLRKWLLACPGQEITPRNIGHFNAFPLFPDPSKPGNGAVPWEGVSPGRIFALARQHPGEQLLIVNHPRFGYIAYFSHHKFDPTTATSPHPDFSFGFDAMELFNGKAQTDLPILLNDWFGLLNHGHRITATAGSDSHQLVPDEVGYARNFVFVGNDEPEKVTPAQIVRAVKRGRVVISLGPFVTFTANGRPIGSLISEPDGPIVMTIHVQSANWVPVSQVELIANGITVKRWKFRVKRGMNWKVTFRLSPLRDAWYLVRVQGPRGGLEPLLRPFRTFGGKTFKVAPIAITNPIWVDRDGNGRFDPPKRRVFPGWK